MLVFKIMTICALVLCVLDALFGLHVLLVSNKTIATMKNWAYEVDKNNLRYITQQFARLKKEHGLVIDYENENNNNEKNENEND